MVVENKDIIKRPQSNNRRNSTGGFSIINSSNQTPPLTNHLRASMTTTSCHDSCKKYGIKPESSTTKTRNPLPKKPPFLPVCKSEIVNVTNNSTSNLNKRDLPKKPPVFILDKKSSNVIKREVIIQQKTKKRFIIPKNPIDLKLKSLSKEVQVQVQVQVQSPSRRRYSDVYNGSVSATASKTGNRDSRNASRDVIQSKNKSKIKIDQQPSFEIPVEKILYVAEMKSCKDEVEISDEQSPIQKLSSKETNDKEIELIDQFSSCSFFSEDSGNTTGSSSSDTLASISITSSETDSDISSNTFKVQNVSCVDDDQCNINNLKTPHLDYKSTNKKNESVQIVVLQPQNQEEKIHTMV